VQRVREQEIAPSAVDVAPPPSLYFGIFCVQVLAFQYFAYDRRYPQQLVPKESMFYGDSVEKLSGNISRKDTSEPEPYFLSSGRKSRLAEFMQYRSPVGAGPSSNTCPR
jgi:hypothetical protein